MKSFGLKIGTVVLGLCTLALVGCGGKGGAEGVIKKVMNSPATKLFSCYQTELIKNPSLKGQVHVSFTFHSKGGRPTDVKVAKSELNNSQVESCLTEFVSSLKFPAIPKVPFDVPVKVTYPFDFAPLNN